MKNSFQIETYAKYPLEMVKGKGSYMYDSDGNKYLDFYGGHAVAILGHSPAPVVDALQKQAEILLFYSNIFHTKPAEELAEKITSTLLPEKYLAYFANSGSEANETALKIARKHTGKQKIISFKNAFHGRSISSLGATGIDSYHQYSPNLDDYTSFAELGDIESVEKAFCYNTAAVICEPIQSIGGMRTADPQFFQVLESFCKSKSILLIIDEIQTGLGRTGTFWFSEFLGIKPDIITTAKGLASGLPISAVLVQERIAKQIKTGDHATTFGGGPVVCAAANATLEIILQTGFLEDVKQKSAYLIKRLQKIPQVHKVHGKGFLLGIKTPFTGKKLIQKCIDNGLIIGTSLEKNTIRIMPPLNISKEEIDEFLSIFTDVLSSLKS